MFTKEDLILKQLDRMEVKVDLLTREVAGLKVKSGIWGAIAGMIPVAIGLGMWLLGIPWSN